MFSRSTVVNLHPSSSPAGSPSSHFYLSPAGPKNVLPPFFLPPPLPPHPVSCVWLVQSATPSPQLLKPTKVNQSAGSSVWDEAEPWPPRVLDVFQPQTGRYTHIMDMCGPTRGCFLCGHFWSIYQSSFVASSSPSVDCLQCCCIEWSREEKKKKKEPLTTRSVWSIDPTAVYQLINAVMIMNFPLTHLLGK